jgi:lysozyme|tara:strand:- start:3138 stop:3602 length:465 start_codon:yes stop_codon:yes gene_type:complete
MFFGKNKLNRESVYEQLKIDEGVVYEVYHDHLGLPTFGVGHLVLESDPEYGKDLGFAVSEDRVKECFEKDLDTAISECEVLYEEHWKDFPGEVKEILVNMMFNMGRTRLSGFKNFKKALEEGNWKKAAVEGRDSKWYRQVTNRADRLMVRMENV